jgi:hypothetical protein
MKKSFYKPFQRVASSGTFHAWIRAKPLDQGSVVMSKVKTKLLGTAALALCTLGAPLAMANVSVDGITMPTGFTVGGYDFSTTTLYENVVTKTGDTNFGVGTVDLIQVNGGGPLTNTYTYGQGGVYLNFIFSGFNVAKVIAPSGASTGTIDFTGGTVEFYADSAPLGVTGTVAAVDSAITTGAPHFLELTAEAQNAAGDSVVATLPAGSTTTNFLDAGSTGFFAASGGDAVGAFSPIGFPNAASVIPVGTSPAGFAAVNFTSDDSTVCGTNAFSQTEAACGPGPEFVSGSGSDRWNAIPEPASLGLLGTALIGFWGAARRRSRKSA